MNKAHIIFALDITDASLMRDYVKQTVLMEFQGVEAARQWYRSSAYQAAAELRHAAARGKVAIVEGIDVRAFTDSTPESVADLIGDRFRTRQVSTGHLRPTPGNSNDP